ncbi:MAG: RNA methyltransferase [Firmicutes bacterium]|nr:RNA methyltransferase [Bacillota bacterium]
MFKEITSVDNKIVKDAVKLLDKKARAQTNKFLAEGILLVKEAVLACPDLIDTIFLDKTKLESKPEQFTHFTESEKLKSKIILLPPNIFKKIADTLTPQGIIAVVNKPQFNINSASALKGADVGALAGAVTGGVLGGVLGETSKFLLLDSLQNPDNLGTIIRTAKATGFNTIFLLNCTDPYAPKVVRGSMGAIFGTAIFEIDRGELLDLLSKNDIPIISACVSGVNLFELLGEVGASQKSKGQNKTESLPNKFCLALGSEAYGLSEAVLSASKMRISLPMQNNTESLNVAVAGGVLMYFLSNLSK